MLASEVQAASPVSASTRIWRVTNWICVVLSHDEQETDEANISHLFYIWSMMKNEIYDVNIINHHDRWSGGGKIMSYKDSPWEMIGCSRQRLLVVIVTNQFWNIKLLELVSSCSDDLILNEFCYKRCCLTSNRTWRRSALFYCNILTDWNETAALNMMLESCECCFWHCCWGGWTMKRPAHVLCLCRPAGHEVSS